MKIISQRHRATEVYYNLSYVWRGQRDAGFSFPCDEDGDVFIDRLAPAGRENLEACITGEHDVICEGVVKMTNTYTVPAVGKCSCGSKVELIDSLDNECDGCGAWYNMSGQQVTPSHECDPYGTPYIDFSDY